MRSVHLSQENSYQCMDYSNDGGSKFIVAGKLPVIELFDDERAELI